MLFEALPIFLVCIGLMSVFAYLDCTRLFSGMLAYTADGPGSVPADEHLLGRCSVVDSKLAVV